MHKDKIFDGLLTRNEDFSREHSPPGNVDYSRHLPVTVWTTTDKRTGNRDYERSQQKLKGQSEQPFSSPVMRVMDGCREQRVEPQPRHP